MATRAARLDPQLIGFDFDGVIADIGEAFVRIACTDYGYCSIRLEDISSFAVEECLDMDRTVIEQIFGAILADSLGTGLKPIPGAIETLTLLTTVADVTVITARPELVPVQDWFDHHCSAEARRRLTLIATGDHDDKERHIRRCGLSHFVDDRTLTCQQLAAAGLSPLVFSQPWNRTPHGLPTVASWKQLEAMFDLSVPACDTVRSCGATAP